MKRVVITGMGAVTPIGNSVAEYWKNALEGKSGAARITNFDPSEFRTQFGCEVKDFQPETYLSREEIRKTDAFTQFALYAATEAMWDSGLDMEKISPFDVGVIWGSGQGGMASYEAAIKEYVQDSVPRFNPYFISKMIANLAGGMISIKFGLQGIGYTTVSACATSTTSMMDAFNYIRWGKAVAFITGGSEAAITEAGVGGFNAMKAMSTSNEDPSGASRPFDVGRNGFVIGEGAGALVLEEYEHAKARGAHIYAEIVGAAMTSDAHHISAPHPEGLASARAMQLALQEAEINPDDVDHINAHATSTPLGDLSEIHAIRTVFGDDPKQLHVTATKSMTGHLLGAAGAIESILTVKALETGIVAPTINTTEVDPEIPRTIQIVLGEARQTNPKIALNNNFGFGGHNAIVALKKF